MKKTAVLVLLLMASGASGADAPPSFAWERAVVAGGAGPNRLDVDLPLLSGGRSLRYAEDGSEQPLESFQGGLDDLRFFDPEGNETAYLLLPPALPHARWETGRITPFPAGTNSGFEMDLRAKLLIDRVDLQGIAAPFMKRLTIEGSADRATWTMLAPDAVVYDLPDEHLTRTTVEFDPGEYRFLRVTWDDRASSRVKAPRQCLARVVAAPEPERRVVKIDALQVDSEPGRSRFRIKLPAGGLPMNAVLIEVKERTFARRATLREPRLSGREVVWDEVGRSEIRRLERNGLIAADMRIPVRRPKGAEMELVVDNGTAEPLQITAVRAELAPLPEIYFETGDPALTARYGSRSVEAPAYELDASRASIDLSRAFEAKWGEPKASEETSDNGDVAVHPMGSMIDTQDFAYLRNIPAEEPGLNSLQLDAAVLAHSTLNDLRIVDDEGRQVPYVLEKRDEPLAVELPMEKKDDTSPGESSYRVDLPFETLPAGSRLLLRTNERVFRRSVRIQRDPTDNQRGTILTSAEWRHDDPEAEPPPLVLQADLRGLDHVTIRIDEGDNSPLVLLPPRILFPSYRLRFYYPRGAQLTLYYGNPRMRPPRYDLELLSARLFSMPAHDVKPSQELEVAAVRQPGPKRFFFAALAGVALILLIVLARLLRLHDEE